MRSTFIEHCHVFFSSIRRLLLFDFGSGTVNNGLVGCIFFLYLSLSISPLAIWWPNETNLSAIYILHMCVVLPNSIWKRQKFNFTFISKYYLSSSRDHSKHLSMLLRVSDRIQTKKNKHNRRTPKPKCVANKFWLGISIVSCHFFMCLYDVWPQSVANDGKRERERELTVEAHIMFWVSISVIYSNPWLNT